MDMVFDDDNARVLRSVHDELVSAVEDDVVAVARIECHQGVTTTKCLGPSGEMISKCELRVVSDGVEIVVAVDQAGQTLLDDGEERVERRECRVLGIGHDLLLGCCVSQFRGTRGSAKGSAKFPMRLLPIDRLSLFGKTVYAFTAHF